MKVVTLKTNYGNPDNGGHINAYTPNGHAAKETFLRDAAKYLRAVGRKLAAAGMTEQSVRPNRGGIAVSGEVYGEFRAPGEDVGVFVEVGSSCVSHLSGRTDGVVIRAVWRCRRRERMHTPEGPNRYLDPANRDSDIMVATLLDIREDGRLEMENRLVGRPSFAPAFVAV